MAETEAGRAFIASMVGTGLTGPVFVAVRTSVRGIEEEAAALERIRAAEAIEKLPNWRALALEVPAEIVADVRGAVVQAVLGEPRRGG